MMAWEYAADAHDAHDAGLEVLKYAADAHDAHDAGLDFENGSRWLGNTRLCLQCWLGGLENGR